jgi:hypothetical protein
VEGLEALRDAVDFTTQAKGIGYGYEHPLLVQIKENMQDAIMLLVVATQVGGDVEEGIENGRPVACWAVNTTRTWNTFRAASSP